jgi:low affinity Fe/Cu permease
MNKTLVLISCVFLILGCANSDYVKIDNRLEEKIRLIINFYQEEVSESVCVRLSASFQKPS